MSPRPAVLTPFLVSLLWTCPGPLDAAEGGPHVRKGRVELSTAASFMNVREGDDDFGEGDSYSILSLPFRVGWMVADPLELEAEAVLSHFTGGQGETGVTVSGNVLYHFQRRERVVPFVLVGGGYGNAVELLNVAVKTGTNVRVLGAGAGFKAFLGDRASLRVEYRFTRFFGEDPDSFSTGSRDLATHRVLLGVSVWFH